MAGIVDMAEKLGTYTILYEMKKITNHEIILNQNLFVCNVQCTLGNIKV